MKGQEITASWRSIGGCRESGGDNGDDRAATTLPATASIGAVVGVGIIAGWTANTIDKKLGVTSEMKKVSTL